MSGSGSASIIDLYDSLLAAEDERSRARIIANAIERLEDRYPELKDLATASGLRETELRLQKEIEQTRLRIEEVRSDLTKEIALGNQKVLRWTTGLMFAQLAAILAALISIYLL